MHSEQLQDARPPLPEARPGEFAAGFPAPPRRATRDRHREAAVGSGADDEHKQERIMARPRSPSLTLREIPQ